MGLKRIIKEEMDWINDVQMALPDSSFLKKPVTTPITLEEFLISQYGYDFINIVFKDGRVIELTMEGDYEVKYNVYKSLEHLVNTEGLSLSNVSFTLEEYLEEYGMNPVPKQVYNAIISVIPLKREIEGIWEGSL